MAQQITIQAIEQKEFRTKARGYDPEEVDTFLDDICDEMERQQNTIASLQQQVREAQNAAQRNPQSTLRPNGADTAELNRLQGMVKSLQQQLNESQAALQDAQAALKGSQADLLNAEQARAAAEKTLREKNQVVSAAPVQQSAAPADAFREILETAQRVKDETIASAKKQAESIIGEARAKAEDSLSELTQEKEALTGQVDALRKTAADYRKQFTDLIRSQQEALKGIIDL